MSKALIHLRSESDTTDCMLRDLIDVSHKCDSRHHVTMAYSSPMYLDFYNRPMQVADIPIESYHMEGLSRKNPAGAPWDDSIKDLIFDLTSVNQSTLSTTCMVLASKGYKYAKQSVPLMHNKYCRKGGVVVCTQELENERGVYRVYIYSDNAHTIELEADSDYVVTILVGMYVYSSTVVFCHDSSSDVYRKVLSMSNDAMWSVQCTRGSFVQPETDPETCSYVCSVYSCLNSCETRAVGTGRPSIGVHAPQPGHIGRLNYYARCVRGSVHSSGRCYDCEILYKTISRAFRLPADNSPARLSASFMSDFMY